MPDFIFFYQFYMHLTGFLTYTLPFESCSVPLVARLLHNKNIYNNILLYY